MRNLFNLPQDKPVLLHVGHIKKSRNVGWLIRLSQEEKDWQVVCVGSTSTEEEKVTRKELEDAGVIVIKDYIKNIETIYQAADVYCFPVQNQTAAIETPLSVLEAMCVNLPIITTPFGRLPEIIPERPHVKYVQEYSELNRAVTSGFPEDCDNRQFAKKFSWDNVCRVLLGA